MIDGLPLVVAVVLKSYNEGGRRYCDCRKIGLGPKDWFHVPVLSMGGGPGRFLSLPVGVGASTDLTDGVEVVLGFFKNNKPVVLGALLHGDAGLVSDDEDEQGVNEDLATAVDADTAALRWDGATVATRDGHIGLTAAEGKDVSAQVDGGVFRVSSNGEASDWAVLARALVAAMAPLYEKVNAQDTQIAILTAIVQAVASAPTVVQASPPPYEATALDAMETTDVAAKVLRVSGEIGG